MFVKTLPVLASALGAVPGPIPASENASKVSLVVGNSAYPRMQLRNAVNDARDVSALLASAGFTVDLQLEVTRSAFIEAIQRFGSAVQRSGTKLAVFYYAGHGVQLDWRNYLLPVDAQVSTGAELKSQCIDIGLLLDTFAAAKDTNHVAILDACRNDPFGGSYKPAQSGLSQVDAPVGSLLAYSTSSGSVAFDGERKNGLYTGHLIREWSRHDANLENALKRVRLNVRLESQGKQVPWESTSLESDIFIFDSGRKQLTDAELENYVREDLAAWERIKSSQNADDWVEYLRTFPDGRFAEIAQFRLTQFLALRPAISAASTATPASASNTSVNALNTLVPVVPPTSTPDTASLPSQTAPMNAPKSIASAATETASAPETAEAVAIIIAQGKPAPRLTTASQNPYSAGRFTLGRLYSVDDEVTYRISDILTGLETSRLRIRITRVDEQADLVEGDDGRWMFDSMGNEIVNPSYGRSDVPAQTVPAELQIGKKWSAAWTAVHPQRGARTFRLNLVITARETTRVSEVDFDAFRIEARGNLIYPDGSFRRLERRYWIVPGLNFAVKAESVAYTTASLIPAVVERRELISLRQHKVGQLTG
jgi:hypothetical protein